MEQDTDKKRRVYDFFQLFAELLSSFNAENGKNFSWMEMKRWEKLRKSNKRVKMMIAIHNPIKNHNSVLLGLLIMIKHISKNTQN